jgi:hypothetical protein
MRLLLDFVLDEENRLRHHAATEGTYRGDLTHKALVKTMNAALGIGISIGLGRMKYKAVPIQQQMLKSA